MRRIVLLLPLLLSCVGSPPPAPVRPMGPRMPDPLPDSSGFGTHVLALARGPGGTLWAGTFGRGIYVMPRDSGRWERITARSNDTTSLASNVINALALSADSTMWYGSVGHGFGRSRDRGRTWQNWTFERLGPHWQFVAADGIRTRGDTVYIATADGLRITSDQGATWRCVQAAGGRSGGADNRADGCSERLRTLPSEYLLALEVAPDGVIWVGHLQGVSISRDQGRTWSAPEARVPVDVRIRAIHTDSASIWLAGETAYYRSTPGEPLESTEPRAPGWPRLPGQPRVLQELPGSSAPLIGLSTGLAAPDPIGEFRLHYLPAGERFRPAADVWSVLWWGSWPLSGTGTGIARILAGEFPPMLPPPRAGAPEAPRQPLLARPIAAGDGNPYVDATYRYGSTVDSTQPFHQGVEFNNPAGTPVRAIADGVVVFVGLADAGSNTVAIRHDQRLGDAYVFSTYYHNAELNVRNGQRVRAGEVVARVGNTGRTRNSNLHLEVHLAPGPDSSKIVHPDVRFPEYTVNPQLWLEPLPGTGIVAGRVLDGSGQPVPGARIHGLVAPYPEETPLSFVETYREHTHAHPSYNENFAIGDIPAGEYVIGAEIGGRKVWRRINVQAGRVTFVEMRPD
jgi:murein DD-endopeptidase MepM/ murein hydrolase activator NlpD